MELLVAVVLILAVWGLLNLVDLRWGVDSRHSLGEWKSPAENNYFQIHRSGVR